MNKKCARCEKTVYPTEELKCLDKVWHKPCFKCTECGMTLNMRNYKGFDKEPYCDAHIPKAKATAMAETPELRRIAENTKIQSNVKYHADFERSKGKFTQVADDPEIQRIKQNSKIISNVAYHGDLQKKAEMEQRRTINENGFKVATTTTTTTSMTTAATLIDQVNANAVQAQPQMVVVAPPATPTNMNVGGKMGGNNYEELQPEPAILNNTMGSAGGGGGAGAGAPASTTPYSSRNAQTLIYTSDRGAVSNQPERHIGSVHDLDPINHNYGSLGRVYRAMYDYEAQDDDEVSFMDGDLIINVSSIDAGWMTGEVQRTGQVGMLPANYVKLANI